MDNVVASAMDVDKVVCLAWNQAFVDTHTWLATAFEETDTDNDALAPFDDVAETPGCHFWLAMSCTYCAE